MSTIEIEAKTMEEALTKASEQLGTARDELEIEVISENSNKLFGIIGGSKVKIRASIREPRPEEEGCAGLAKEVLENILYRFGVSTAVEVTEDDECINLEIKSDGSGILIGRKGQTLDALQYLVNKIARRSPAATKQIIIDTEGYRRRRKDALIGLAKRLGEQAKAKDMPVSTNPLNPFERRIIHLALQDDAALTTQSNGEGVYRSVVISPKKPDAL
jgi:spoIIIJ-associated protein